MDNQLQKNTSEYTTSSNTPNYHLATINYHKHHIKSRDYSPEHIAQMAQRLNAISLSMGFGKVNSPEVLLALSQWIKEQFGDMSMQEVALAFDLVTSKKIGAEIRHYNSFSKQYIGEVLSAFREFRSKQIKLLKESEDNKRLSEHVKLPTGEEMYNGIKNIALDTGKLMRAADWSAAFLYAQKEGLIDQLNNDEKQMYLDNVRASLKSEAVKSPDYQELLNTLTNPDSLITECRRRILHTHFQKMIDDSKVSKKGNG